MDGGSISKCGSRLSAAHIRFQSLQQVQGVWLASQKWCFGTMSDCEGSALTLIHGAEVPRSSKN
eukprot:5670706-Pyramimonas_sp.AAC.1